MVDGDGSVQSAVLVVRLYILKKPFRFHSMPSLVRVVVDEGETVVYSVNRRLYELANLECCETLVAALDFSLFTFSTRFTHHEPRSLESSTRQATTSTTARSIIRTRPRRGRGVTRLVSFRFIFNRLYLSNSKVSSLALALRTSLS